MSPVVPIHIIHELLKQLRVLLLVMLIVGVYVGTVDNKVVLIVLSL